METAVCSTREKETIVSHLKTLYLRPKENILFVVDENYRDIDLARIFSGYPHDIVYIPVVERPSQNYELDMSLLNGKTVGWLITTVSISHAPSTKKMLQSNMYLISNPGMTPDWMPALRPENREICNQTARRLLRLFGGNVGGSVRITSSDGTDLTLQVPNGNWCREVGLRTTEDFGTNGPFGELFTAPYAAEGILILNPGDFLTNPINELTEKIELFIHDNKVVEIKGGDQAELLIDLLQLANNGLAYNLGKFSFGLNPAIVTKIRSVIAEKELGTVHIASGTNEVCLQANCPEINLFPYGRYNAGVHIDFIKSGANVVFIPEENTQKDKTVIRKGVIQI